VRERRRPYPHPDLLVAFTIDAQAGNYRCFGGLGTRGQVADDAPCGAVCSTLEARAGPEDVSFRLPSGRATVARSSRGRVRGAGTTSRSAPCSAPRPRSSQRTPATAGRSRPGATSPPSRLGGFNRSRQHLVCVAVFTLSRPAFPVGVQRRCWALIRAGEVVGDAADLVGVSRPVAWRWFRNAGGVMPFVLPAVSAGSLPSRPSFRSARSWPAAEPAAR